MEENTIELDEVEEARYWDDLFQEVYEAEIEDFLAN